MGSVVIPLNRMRVCPVAQEGKHPSYVFYRDLAFMHIVNKSLMMYIVKSSRDIHEYC